MKNPDRYYRGRHCPDGTEAASQEDYFAKWNSFIKKLEEITGLRCTGFDPDVCLAEGDSKRTWQSVQIPLWFAHILVEKFEEKKIREGLLDMDG